MITIMIIITINKYEIRLFETIAPSRFTAKSQWGKCFPHSSHPPFKPRTASPNKVLLIVTLTFFEYLFVLLFLYEFVFDKLCNKMSNALLKKAFVLL